MFNDLASHAAPMIIPIAMSSMLPHIADSLKHFKMLDRSFDDIKSK
jgi:hypothetical protein